VSQINGAFIENFGFDAQIVTFSFTSLSILEGDTSTLILRPSSTSLACVQNSDLTISLVQGCDPSKMVSFFLPFNFQDYFLNKVAVQKYLIINLPTNYRPPSEFGRAIPTSPNMYNADPSKPRHFDKYKLSQNTGSYKQCAGKPDRAACGCTLSQLYSGFEKDSDCMQVVYGVPWRQVWLPSFNLSMMLADASFTEVTEQLEFSYTLEELNGRTDYCFKDSSIDCKDPQQVNSYMLSSQSFVGIQFSGSELFHFRMHVQTKTYCHLTTEFVVWANNPPLPESVMWVTISSAAICIAALLFVGFMVYSYLYNSDQ